MLVLKQADKKNNRNRPLRKSFPRLIRGYLVNTKLDALGSHSLLDLRLDKKALAFVIGVSITTIEELARGKRLKGSRKGRKCYFSVEAAVDVLKAYEVRARRQDATFNELELEILRVASVEDKFVGGKLYSTKQQLSQMFNVSERTIEVWAHRGFLPVSKLLSRRNLYPSFTSLFCAFRHRKISPSFLALILWADRPRFPVQEDKRELHPVGLE